MSKILSILFAICLSTAAWAQKTTLPSLHVEGKWLVDTYGNHVVLHGVMDTPSNWFNGYQDSNNHHYAYWEGGYDANGAKNCVAYFHKLFGAMQQSNCDVFRLHLDPAWTSGSTTAAGFTKNAQGKTVDPIGQVVENEADISRFDPKRLSTFMKSVYIPLMMDALDHGLYVVVRPPGVCPGEIRVDGYYQKYLIEVWDSVSKNDIIKSHAGQISIELANEPVSIKTASGGSSATAMRDFFQPVVDKIRANGFTGVIWVPGTGWQANYADYKTYPVKDVLNNFGYAVHDYDGWYGLQDKYNSPSTVTQATKNKITQFHNQVPVVDTNPVIITEIDWSPKKSDVPGHENEHGEQVEGNLGTWATGRTSVWGIITKNVYDHYGNISMTLSGSHCLFDIQTLLKTGEVVPAFDGYEEACGKACMDWYAEYAKVNNPVADYVNIAPNSDLGNGKFMNPVVRADFPDPDVIRVGEMYYMVSTTMSLFPGATILKSRDMVNWEYCAQPLTQLSTGDNYNLKNGQDAYAKGMWAPSMKYYNGKFYLLINGSDTGYWLLTAENPEGTWQKKKLDHGYYDPGMLFDNGKVYIACGAGKIKVCELDLNFNFIQEKEVIDRNGTQLEGSHFYKRNGYYYIYATYAGWPDQQVVFRSKNIFGPYEEKQVLEQTYGNTPNLIHQGSLIQDVKGNWWTIMQEDLGSLGRFPNLQPVKWVNDWPVVGNNGTPYKSFVDEITKPATSDDYYLTKAMPTTDNFRSYPLGMQWEWNHNPDNNNWSLFERAGWLRLKTNSVVSSLPQARNMLTQRIFIDKEKATTGTVRLDVSRLNEGDRAGICIFQDPYAAIALEVKNGNRQLVWFQDKVKDGGQGFSPAEKTKTVELTDNIVYLRAAVKYGDNKAYFYYSTDGTTWERLGNETSQHFNLSVFFGARFGLFCYSTQSSGGSADFDWFSTEASYDEEGLYGAITTVLDEKKFTVTKIVPAKKTIETMVGGANSPGIKATFKDNHTENVSIQSVFESEQEGIVEFRNGQMFGLAQGSTRVAVSFTDDFGNKVDTAFTAVSSYFPLDEQFITTNLAGNAGTYKRLTNYGKFTFSSKDNQMGWNFDNYLSKGVKLNAFNYLVVRLNNTNASSKASINFYASATNMNGGCSVPLSTTDKVTVIDLKNMQYTFGSNTGKKFTPSAVHKVTFSSAATSSTYRYINVAEIYLTNDDPTGINEVEWQQPQHQTVNVYSLSGRMVRRAVSRTDALRGLPAGLYIVDGEKVLVK
jgi:beta-xylosidase